MKTVLDEAKNRIDLYDEAGKHVGEIEFMRGGNGELYATHTEVFPGVEGKGYGAVLVDALAQYARENNAKITPICSFVKARFLEEPEKYADVRG